MSKNLPTKLPYEDGHKVLDALQEAMVFYAPPAETRAQHYFANGVYVRHYSMDAETLVIGKIHKYPCVNITLGFMQVWCAEEGSRYIGPGLHVWVSKPGVRRLVRSFDHEIHWFTCHRTDTTDHVEAVEELTEDPPKPEHYDEWLKRGIALMEMENEAIAATGQEEPPVVERDRATSRATREKAGRGAE